MKTILSVLLSISYIFAYITATDGGLDVTNKLVYQNGKFINVNEGYITTNLPKIDKHIMPYHMKYRIIKKKVKCDEFDEGKNCIKNEKYVIVNYKDLFSYVYYAFKPDQKILLVYNQKVWWVKTKSEYVTLNNKIFDKVQVEKRYIQTFGTHKQLFGLYLKDKLPIRVDIDQNEPFNLIQIYNQYVANYEKYLKLKPTNLNNFDFKKEPIWATFKANTKNGMRYLNVEYKMVNPENDLFLLQLKGSGLILAPSKNSDYDYIVDSYIVDMGNDNPFEYQKVLNIGGENVLLWRQLPNSSNVPLVYKDENGKQRQKGIIRGSKPLYDIGGIWYLVSWLDKTDKTIFHFSYVDTGRVEGKVSKIDNRQYLVTAGLGDSLLIKYKFILDKYHRVIRVEDLKNSLVITLHKPYMNKTIQENIKFLQDYKARYNLKVIK